MRKVHVGFSLVLAAWAWILAPQVLAQDADTIARLTRQIDALAAFFPPGGNKVPETLVDSMIDGKARIQAFRLESLMRLYQRARPDLDRYRLKVKELEDGLGAYTFAADSLSFARDKFRDGNKTQAPGGAQQAEQQRVLDSLRKQRETARGVLAKLVERSTLDSDLPKLRSLVASEFDNWSASRDLSYVKGELVRMLRHVRDGRFDFNKLEDGIHEFRRQLRWFPVVIDALDGLVMVRDDEPGACPVPALEALAGSSAAKHRYSNPALRFPARSPCTISRCLLWQVVKTTNDLGRVKDEALGNASIAAALDDDIYVAVSDRVTREEIARARTIRAELFSSRALDSLMSQLSSCKS